MMGSVIGWAGVCMECWVMGIAMMEYQFGKWEGVDEDHKSGCGMVNAALLLAKVCVKYSRQGKLSS
jgi:hypothetical protein